MDNTWVKLYRKISEHEVLHDANGLKVFIWLLTRVDKKTGKLIIGRFRVSEELHMNPSTFRDTIYRLRDKYKIIDTKSDNKKTEISLSKWAIYNPYAEKTTPIPTTRRQRDDNETTLIQEYKTIRSKDNKSTTYSSPLIADFLIYLAEFNKLFETEYQDTDGRRKSYSTRRKRFSAEQIMLALANLNKSKFHRGINDKGWRADPGFLLRNDEQIDKWLNYKEVQEPPAYVKI